MFLKMKLCKVTEVKDGFLHEFGLVEATPEFKASVFQILSPNRLTYTIDQNYDLDIK
jgi:hypothetical protein